MGTVLRLDKHRGYEVELSEYQSRRCRQRDSYTACSDAQQCGLNVGLCLEGVHQVLSLWDRCATTDADVGHPLLH